MAENGVSLIGCVLALNWFLATSRWARSYFGPLAVTNYIEAIIVGPDPDLDTLLLSDNLCDFGN